MRAFVAVLVCVLASFAGLAAAQAFPARPLHLVVPFPPGGIGDIQARIIAEELARHVAQPVIVDNKPGAGAVLAYEFVQRAPGDGYTMLLVFPSFVINPLVRRVGYDPVRDFKPIGQTVSVPLGIAVNNDIPAKSLQEFVELARRKPGELAYGTPGVGTTQHVFGEMFQQAAGIKLTHAPYQGGAPAITALVGGHIAMVIGNVTEFITQVQGGKLRALAVTSAEREEALPDVPTLRESGFNDLDTTNWAGIVVPAATPDAIVARLSSELLRALGSPEVREKLKAQRLTPVPTRPDEFRELLHSESSRYARVVRNAKLQLD